MKVIYNSILPIVLFLCGCKEEYSIEEKVYTRINSCETAVCKFSIKEFTPFDWDTAFLFTVPRSVEAINKKIGTTYAGYKEFTRPFIFLKNGSVIYYENNPSGLEGLLDNQIVFGNPDDTSICKVVSAKENDFIGRIKKSGHKRYIELTRVLLQPPKQ